MQAICVYARGFASAVYNGRLQHDSLEREQGKVGKSLWQKRKEERPEKGERRGEQNQMR